MRKTIKFSLIILFGITFIFPQVKLDVNTIPKKVDIHLDGVNIGSSPIRNERITPGVHKFEIKSKGYAPLTYDLLVNPAQAIELDFFLNPIYECKFKTEEKGLVFELNGEFYIYGVSGITIKFFRKHSIFEILKACVHTLPNSIFFSPAVFGGI